MAGFSNVGGCVQLGFGVCGIEGLPRNLSCLMGWVLVPDGQRFGIQEGIRIMDLSSKAACGYVFRSGVKRRRIAHADRLFASSVIRFLVR